MSVKHTLKDVKNLAQIRGGKCLSTEYINNWTPLKWMCKQGHTWDRPYDAVQQGAWCGQCVKNDKYLELVNEIAISKGGVCLSDLYINSQARLKFQCKNKHQFTVNYSNLKLGTWCRECYQIQRKAFELEKIKKIAIKNGGICLSTKYESKSSLLKFQCKNGHVFNRVASNTIKKKGNWCAKCDRDEVCKKILLSLNKLAIKKGGKCISKSFHRTDFKLKWECKNGHVFNATTKSIRKGTWCAKCAYLTAGEKTRKYTLNDFKDYAKLRGGKLLSKKFISTAKKLTWQCARGHVWESLASCAVHKNNWCQQCQFEENRTKISELIVLAKKNGGRLLSKEFINNTQMLEWECKHHHQWKASAQKMKRGIWCAECKLNEANEMYYQKLKKLAESKNGKLLSKKYIRADGKLDFQCVKGHKWRTTPNSIHSGSWCVQCYYLTLIPK